MIESTIESGSLGGLVEHISKPYLALEGRLLKILKPYAGGGVGGQRLMRREIKIARANCVSVKP